MAEAAVPEVEETAVLLILPGAVGGSIDDRRTRGDTPILAKLTRATEYRALKLVSLNLEGFLMWRFMTLVLAGIVSYPVYSVTFDNAVFFINDVKMGATSLPPVRWISH